MKTRLIRYAATALVLLAFTAPMSGCANMKALFGDAVPPAPASAQQALRQGEFALTAAYLAARTAAQQNKLTAKQAVAIRDALLDAETLLSEAQALIDAQSEVQARVKIEAANAAIRVAEKQSGQ